MDDEQSEVEAGKGISITENAVTHGFAKAIGWKEVNKLLSTKRWLNIDCRSSRLTRIVSK